MANTPSREQLEEKVRVMVQIGSGLPARMVIPGNDNAPRPRQSFAVLTLREDKRLGYPYYRYYDDPAETREAVWESRVAEYQIMFFGDEGDGVNIIARPQNFQTWVISTAGILHQQHNKITVQSHSDIRQTDHRADIWESRASMDIEVAYKRTSTSDVGWIDNVDIFVHHRDDPSIDRTIQIRRP